MHSSADSPTDRSTAESPLDTLYQIETPEGIDLSVQVAGPVPRILAYAVDLLYRTLILVVLGIALTFAGKAGVGFWLLGSFILEWFYPVFFEMFRGGQTPGKRAFSLAVVNDNLTPISWGASIMRNLLRFTDFLPFGYCAGMISMSASRYFQRLGDYAAGTLVIYRQEEGNPVALPQVPPAPPPRGLMLQDQQAIISLTERSAALSKGRQQELAEILEPITGYNGEVSVRYLQGVGRWLIGTRQKPAAGAEGESQDRGVQQ
ncbi:RDD family protein [Microbulbifer agarilyticus]